MPECIAAIDQGTTSTRCILFSRAGHILASARSEHQQILPRPGHVEHDPREILDRARQVIRGALERAGLTPSRIAALGITNQRETTILWDRRTGAPLHNAIVWQDTRTDALCRELAANAGPDRFRAQTGLPLATYFAGPKMRWLLDNVPNARAMAENGDALLGTVDAWLIWWLTGGPGGGRHVTDVSNASRTMLMDLRALDWDAGLLDAFGVPRAALPDIVGHAEVIAEAGDPLPGVPVAAAMGDQQAALFGQACFDPGETKNTYGTGSFLLMNTGEAPVASRHGLLASVGYRLAGQPAQYVLEGSIAVTGALIQWLRDNLGLIRRAAEVEDLARSVDDNGGVYIVPAFSGLFAPRWRDDARGVIVGLTGYANKGHIARAALEAAAYQTRDVVSAMERDAGITLPCLRVDGGMTANDLLMGFQADILDVPVRLPAVAETTALGAAYAAGLAVGFWSGLDELRAHQTVAREWTPAMDAATRERLLARWDRAVERALGWETPEPAARCPGDAP